MQIAYTHRNASTSIKKSVTIFPSNKELTLKILRMCEPLRRLTSVKTKYTLNKTYQELYNKAEALIRRDACMEFSNEKYPLNLETDTLVAGLLQVRHGINCPKDTALDNPILRPIAFSSKSLSSTDPL